MTQVLTIVIPIVVVVLGWYLNEKSKRKWEAYKRKEDNYKELIRTLQGFYQDQVNSDLRQEFLYQLNLCWLYGSDKVIRSAYSFLDTVHTAKIHDDSGKEEAMGSLVSSIRRDLLSGKTIGKSNLTGKDFRHLKAT